MSALPDWIGRALAGHGVPGAVVARLHRGQPHILTHGVTSVAAGEPVTQATVFPIASCAKAFTAAACAIQVERGALSFDAPVHELLPELTLDDPWITAQVSLRDLLGMRLGLLGVGTLNWGQNRDLPLASVLGRLRHLPRMAPFRAYFSYLNPAYAAAAELVARSAGVSFTRFLEQEIFGPLQMTDTLLDEGAATAARDIALPHYRRDAECIALAQPQSGGRAGDSCLYVSGRDALRWLAWQLDGRTPGGTALLPDAPRQDLHADQVIGPPDTALGQHFFTYCMGWQARDFRGRRVLCHEGGELGARSFTLLCPELDFAVAVYANLAAPAVVRGLAWQLLDQACGGTDPHWVERMDRIEADTLAHNLAALTALCPVDPQARPPRHITGRYHDEANGRLDIVETADGLELRLADARLFDCRLEPLGGDSFGLTPLQPAAAEPYGKGLRARLSADTGGRVSAVLLPSMQARFTREE